MQNLYFRKLLLIKISIHDFSNIWNFMITNESTYRESKKDKENMRLKRYTNPFSLVYTSKYEI